MSIRAEEKPKAFEAQFMHMDGSVAQYGAFDFKPGSIVRRKTRWKKLIKHTNIYWWI